MVENVPPTRVWEALRSDPKAQLVDVRTDAEWNFVGVPDLASAGKQVVLIPWQVYPTMQPNAAFTDQLKEAGFAPEQHIYFICRSGQRSFAAAQAAQAAGFPLCLQCRGRLRRRGGRARPSRRRGGMEGEGPTLAATLTQSGTVTAGPYAMRRPAGSFRR